MEYKLLSYEELKVYFSVPYNPPLDSAERRDEFSHEYWRLHARVGDALRRLGGSEDPIAGDFTMNESRGNSRWISVQLLTDRLITRKTIPAIAEVLSKMNEDYAVCVSHDCLDEPLFHVIVFRDLALAEDSASEWLRRLGFDASIQ